MKQEDRLTSPTLKSNFKHCVDAYSKELLTKCYWEIYDKLCAYEEKALSPEEIDTLKSENARLTEELKQSVKLPCKVGDTVYVICECKDIHMRCDDDYLTGTGNVECPFENQCCFEDCDDNQKQILETVCAGFMIEEGCTDGFHTFFDGLNAKFSDDCWEKTVFLTREAAEDRLKELEKKA